MLYFFSKIKSRVFQFFLFLIAFIILFQELNFRNFLIANALFQFIIFLFIVCIPAYLTNRMSYVDIAWPLGLIAIGVLSFICGDGYLLRKILIATLYILAGLRMGIGALIFLKKGYLNKELPRYQYQRIRWKKKGFTNNTFSIQYEILLQCFANVTFLAIPALLISNNSYESFSLLEIAGLLLWVVFFITEHIADLQKKEFLVKAKKQNLKNQVCDVGLWKYSRHPNYFSEWMLWNSLIISSISSLLTYYDQNIFFFGMVLTVIYISVLMYQTLVYLTGAVPSEYYSIKKRPDYSKYKENTSMFFPKFF